MLLAAVLWVLRTLEPYGTPWATSVCRAARITACIVQVSGKKKENLVDPPTLWKTVFFPPSSSVIDPQSDRVNPEEPTLARARGEIGVFEAGICLLCRERKQKPVRSCWFVQGIHCSTGFEKFACTLNWLPVPFSQREPAVWLFFPTLYLFLPLSHLHFCFPFHPPHLGPLHLSLCYQCFTCSYLWLEDAACSAGFFDLIWLIVMACFSLEWGG